MKKFPYALAGILIALVAFSSCKRDYVCKCSLDVNFFGAVTADTSYIIPKTTKKKAKEQCNESNTQYSITAGLLGGTGSCSLNK